MIHEEREVSNDVLMKDLEQKACLLLGAGFRVVPPSCRTIRHINPRTVMNSTYGYTYPPNNLLLTLSPKPISRAQSWLVRAQSWLVRFIAMLFGVRGISIL